MSKSRKFKEHQKSTITSIIDQLNQIITSTVQAIIQVYKQIDYQLSFSRENLYKMFISMVTPTVLETDQQLDSFSFVQMIDPEEVEQKEYNINFVEEDAWAYGMELKQTNRALTKIEEQALIEWIKKQTDQGRKITKYQVRQCAMSISKKSGFRGSQAWIRKFLTKYHIKDLVEQYKYKENRNGWNIPQISNNQNI